MKEYSRRFGSRKLPITRNYKHKLLILSSKDKKIIENSQEVDSNSLIIPTMKCSKSEKGKSLLGDVY